MNLEKSIKYLSFCTLIIAIFFIITFLLNLYLYSLNKDIANVTLEGNVYDSSSKMAVHGATLKITNNIYEGGDFESYGKYEERIIKTDKNGFYTTKFDISANLTIEVMKKGYSSIIVNLDTTNKNIKKDFFLK